MTRNIQNPPEEICGIIMPISETPNRTEQHWNDIRRLLHRTIADAGFIPVNVWENSSTDRISERIIANIFSCPIIVADISDLNPNVMLELGMRLASQKPTIVIVNSGGVIPFDIRDFHIIHYPSDTNILEMEVFFEQLSSVLNTKMNAFRTGKHIAFLKDVMIDVLAPSEREVTTEDLILSNIEEIKERISRIEQQSGENRISSLRSHMFRYDASDDTQTEVVEAAREKISRLTPRELDVLKGLIEGKANKIIAYELDISPRTIEIYRANLLDKLELRSIAEAVRLAFIAGMVPLVPGTKVDDI